MPDLEDKIRSWLDEQGYPLEMRVARAFRQVGFRVFQSDYYRDPQTNNEREIDVVAYADIRIDDLLLRVQFIVECKSARSKPWLVFCSPDVRLAPPARVAQRTASKAGSLALGKLAQRKDIQALNLFHIPDAPAYAATQAFTTGSDVVYTALTGLGAAASAKAKEADEYVRRGNRFCIILFPLVVIEGRLFSCVLADDAGITIAEAKQATLIWRNPVAREPHTIVNILTDPILQAFASASKQTVDDFFALVAQSREVFDQAGIVPRSLR
ncbi:MAG: hypothetical protein ACJ8NS_06890 [Chthoniobacterales bacterium]